MSNGENLLNEMDFDKQMAGMDDRKLLEFTARRVYKTYIQVGTLTTQAENQEDRLVALESTCIERAKSCPGSIPKKAIAASSGIGGLIGLLVGGAIDYFTNRGGQ